MMQFRVYRNWLRQWRWTLVAANGRKIATSGEGYRNKADCLDAIVLVKQSASAQTLEKN
jgi:uncharacterized protein YegP (UPF0339 family)